MEPTWIREALHLIPADFIMFGNVCRSFDCDIQTKYSLVITPYLPRIKQRKEKNLLSGNEQEEEEVEEVCLIFTPCPHIETSFLAGHYCTSLAPSTCHPRDSNLPGFDSLRRISPWLWFLMRPFCLTLTFLHLSRNVS